MRRSAEAGGAEENLAIWRQLDLHVAEIESEASKAAHPAFGPFKAQMPLLFDVAETMAKAGATPYSKFKRYNRARSLHRSSAFFFLY